MSKVKVSGIIVSMVAMVLAAYSANVVATDLILKAKSPVSEVVAGRDVKFNWTYSPWKLQCGRTLYTSADKNFKVTDDWHFTWPDFPYGYGWWYVESGTGLCPLFVLNSTSATPFHHSFPNDSPDEFIYTTKFSENRHLKFFELEKDYTIDLIDSP